MNVVENDYDKDLVSRKETTQDGALKKLYADYENGVVKKKKMLAFCYTLGHKIMPSIAIWFVISYWLAGMLQVNELDFEFNVTVEIIFTVTYYLVLFCLNFFWKDLAQLFKK